MANSSRSTGAAPSYLDVPEFALLAQKLRNLGFGLGWTPSHLLAGGIRIRHERCLSEPQRVISQILSHCDARSTTQAESRVDRPTHYRNDRGTLPGQEYTMGGQHISERSG
ncbi:hypothetical protein BH10ACT2_BH10ACT2_19650 [soil metagenome]